MDEWNTLLAEADSALGVLADLRVSASLVMLILVALGVRRLERLRRARAAAGHLSRRTRWRTMMNRLQSSPAARAVTARLHAVRRSASQSSAARLGEVTPALAALRVHPARAALLAVAALSLVVFVVAGGSALFGLPTAPAAGWGLLIAAGCVAALRALAVRDGQSRLAQAPVVVEAVVPVETVDAAPQADPERDRRTLQAVLAFGASDASSAAGSTAVEPEAVTAAVPVVTPGVLPGSVVIPSVPRPTYLDAPEMVRPAPVPLAVEDAPAASGRIKDGVRTEVEVDAISPTAARDIAALDLDSVLARRRAS